jgi:2-aminoadipate transaminase
MSDKKEGKSVNFLRGVPHEEALSHIIHMVAEGYDKVIRQYGTEVLQYGHFSGFAPLRKILGGMHDVDPERVIAGNGGMEMISLFFKSLPRESCIIVEESTYDRVVLDAARYGHKLIGIEITPDGIKTDPFKNALNQFSPAAFYGIPFHHNPTGVNYATEVRIEVEKMCKQHGIPCVWDISYESLRYDGKQNDPIKISDWGPIVINSFTKTISPGTKCGYMILPKDQITHMMSVISNTRINPNLPTQAFIADFIETGKYDHFLDYLRKLYRPRMEALNESLNTHFAGAFPGPVSGGFFTTLTLKTVKQDQEANFLKSAKDAGVNMAAAWDAIAPNLLKEKRHQGLFIRLTFPANNPEDITWGISKLKELVE